MFKFFQKWIIAVVLLCGYVKSIDAALLLLEHINTKEKLIHLKRTYPLLEESVLEEGYWDLPDENDFSLMEENLLQKYPVYGMWIIFEEDTPIGRIKLFKPSKEDGRSEIQTWIDPDHRGKGKGTTARKILYALISPFVNKTIEINSIISISHARRVEKNQKILFKGVKSEISIENYGSLISQLRSYAGIVGYEADGKRILKIILSYPFDAMKQGDLEKDLILKALKQDVEPLIVNKKTQAHALQILWQMERGIFD